MCIWGIETEEEEQSEKARQRGTERYGEKWHVQYAKGMRDKMRGTEWERENRNVEEFVV